MVDFPERMTLESANVTDERLDALRSVFPEVFREGKVDFDALKRSLGENVDSGPERFGLTWPGKAECARVIQTPSVGTLLPMKEESVDWDTTQNVIIEGENLEVLKLLQKAYYGKVKLIYIDPPYNTGNEFVYPDNFKEGLADYLKYSGQVDGEGLKVSANSDTDGRYHSKWLSMMYPRLFLARNLLREDGALFVSIDDHESANLRILLDEIFGQECFVASIIWQRSHSPRNSAANFSVDHDSILVYAKNPDHWAAAMLPRTEQMDAKFQNPDDDPRGRWFGSDLSARNYYSKGLYPVVTPSGRTVEGPGTGRYWSVSEEKLRQLDGENRVWWGKDKSNKPTRKVFLTEVQDGRVVSTVWVPEDVGFVRQGKQEVLELVPGEEPFDTPKPTKLIERILTIATSADDKDCLILDFFAGSGTTGDAVLRANARDGGNRRYVMVQLPAIEETGKTSIASFLRKRMRSAGSRLSQDQSILSADTGFRSFRLTSSNFIVWDGSSRSAEQLRVGLGALSENVVAGRTQTDIVAELLLKLGFPITTPIVVEAVAGKTVYSAADGAVMFFLDDRISIEIIEWMVEKDPARIVVLEAAFGGDDELKVNAVQTVRAKAAGKQSEMVLKVV
jgi:adenine-specific DNA-methyltransferase